MPKDYANIYNLSVEDYEIEKQDLWKDAIPGMVNLADSLLRKISDDEYPYVLSVEASYGMGKTYFFSRFCEYANSNGYNCIYISAWENDYQPSPFCFIVKEILNYLTRCITPSSSSIITKLKERAVNVTKKILSSSTFHIGVNVGVFSSGAETNINNLCASFLETTDYIKEFKKTLIDILVDNRMKPLIIIVDELDRCRPDYALKTLEIIKHFFDLSNLYVILPVNTEALTQAVESTYGQITNSENYMRKFITETYKIPTSNEEDYKKVIKTYITKTKLQKPIKNNFIEENDNFNGFNTIIECLTKYTFNGKLTYREVIKVCNEFLCLANNINKKLLAEYIIFKLCHKYKPKNVYLDSKHPFYISGYDNAKAQIMNISDLGNLTYNLCYNLEHNYINKSFYDEIKQWEKTKGNFKTYESFYNYINNVLKNKNNVLKCRMRTSDGEKKFLIFFEVLEAAKASALEYQRKYGSNDNDSNEKEYYDKIIENNLCLYNV